MPRGKRLILLLAAACAVLVGLGVVAYATFLDAPGDVSNPDVPFSETPDPTPTPTPEPKKGKAKDTFQWPMYGYTKDHRRVFKPQKPLDGPWFKVWKRKTSALAEFPPVIDGPTLYQLVDDGWLTARKKKNGKVRWKRRLGTLAASTPAIEKGTLFVTLLERSKGAKRGRIVALRARDGKIRWSRPLASRSESSPLVHDGRVHFGTEDGRLLSLRARDGRVMWGYRAAGAVKASPTLADGKLFFGDYGGQMQAIRVRDGKLVWRNREARALLRGGEYYATAAAAFGRVYAGSTDGRMYSFAQKDGRLAWAHQTGRYVYSSASIDSVKGLGPTVFFGSYDGTFYALDARSGKERWRYRSGGKISGSPTIIGDTVWFSDLGRSRTLGLRTRDGLVRYRFKQGGYDPATSDGRRLYLTGRFSLTAFRPLQRR